VEVFGEVHVDKNATLAVEADAEMTFSKGMTNDGEIENRGIIESIGSATADLAVCNQHAAGKTSCCIFLDLVPSSLSHFGSFLRIYPQ
jgi:hypothetical protein